MGKAKFSTTKQIKKMRILKQSGATISRYKWCPYCQKFHPKGAFYNNAWTVDGLQTECIPVSLMRNSLHKITFKEALARVSEDIKGMITKKSF